MDNFIFLPDRSKVSAGNSATGELSVALGKNCTASGNYSVAMGYCSSATGQNSFADGSGCDASGSESVAMGWGCRTAHHATGGRQIAVGNLCYAEGSQSVAMGHACYAGSNGAVAMGYDCSAQGGRAFAMGENCDASGSHSVALGMSTTHTAATWSLAAGHFATTMADTTVALGSSAIATGQLTGSRSVFPSGTTIDISNVFFVYRSSQGNSIEFVDKTATNAGTSADFGSNIGLRYRSVDGSASELIFAAPAGSGGAAPVGTSLYERYATAQIVSATSEVMLQPVGIYPDGGVNGTFSLPNDARMVSVTAWTCGDGAQCGGGVTFNIPSSTLRTWYWGVVDEGGGEFLMRLWSIPEKDMPPSAPTANGFAWGGGAGGGGAVEPYGVPTIVGPHTYSAQLWGTPAGAGGSTFNTYTTGGATCPGAASPGYALFEQAQPHPATSSSAGMKVSWIE